VGYRKACAHGRQTKTNGLPVEGLTMSFTMPINASNELRGASKERKTLLSLPFPVRKSHSASVEGSPQEKYMSHIAKDTPCPPWRYAQIPQKCDAFCCFFRSNSNGGHPRRPRERTVRLCRRNRAAPRPYLGGKGVTQQRRCRAVSSVASSGNVGVARSDQRPAA